ncbi:MAG TPA: tetratricopeptide repeat protein [Candidatus Binataceae bacterium]|jgi:tetratricopeptide (TPR) repeat protein|nr:tetratricopeptide repeat protein [Candidatus Binataceae bacterium]
MRQRRTLTIRREDHLEDEVGAIFFAPAEGNEHSILRRLGDYLGPRVTLIRAEIEATRLTVEVHAQCFSEESARLAAAAKRLWSSGGRRGALAMIKDALALDALSQQAAAGLGLLLLDSDAAAEALAAFKRARELGPESAEILRHLARACLALERKASAVAYLREAIELAPRDFQTLRMLDQLGYRKPRAEAGEDEVAAEASDPPPHRARQRGS